MDDLVLPLALAFTVTALAHIALSALLAFMRDWALRRRMGQREAATSRP